MTKYCDRCKQLKTKECENGYTCWWKDEARICPYCGGEMIDIDFPPLDMGVLLDISKETSFIEAMMDLYKSDPIEYQLKMSTFRMQSKQIQKEREKEVERELKPPHCPKCGSTNITTGARGINFFWGPIGASKTVNRCANCGYTWKP